MSPPVFAVHAPEWRAAGWAGTLLLPAGKKWPPPEGFTGADGRDPTDDEVQEWAQRSPAGNYAVRVPLGAIGLDVDAYKPVGAESWQELNAACGPLPDTWILTSREPPSGIRLFRVPPGVRLRGAPRPGIEIIQHHHRYAVGNGCRHPDGMTYRLLAPGGEIANHPPSPADLPILPKRWLVELSEPVRVTGTAPERRHAGGWSPSVTKSFADAVAGLVKGSRHDTATASTLALARYERLEHPGATDALDALGRTFTQAITDRATPKQADDDWTDILDSARDLAATTPSHAPAWGELRTGDPPTDGHTPTNGSDPYGDVPPPTDDDAPTAKRGPGRPAAATELVAMAEARYRFAQADDGRPFAVPLNGPAIAVPLDGTRASLRTELAALYYAQHDKTPGRSALIDALAVLEGRAASVERERLALRFAHDQGRVVIDLGDPTGAAVIVDSDGWRITDRPPVTFRRTELTGALPVPVAGGDLDLLLGMLNVRLEDWLLLVAWVAACALNLPRPILLLTGEQGTGKTTAARVIVSTIDPSPVPVRAAPRDVEAWIVSAAGSALVAIDNLSTIAEWLSDALCRAATGEGLVRRQLYTDGGLAVTSFRRSVILTSIDPGTLRGDLAERLLPIELEPIPADRRRTDTDLAAHFDQVHARVLGVLLDLVADVLRAMPDVELAELPRMADFARVLAAIDHAHGTSTLARYIEVTEDVARDLIESDPLAGALIALSHQDWTGTAAELCTALEAFHQSGSGGWPRTPKTMSSALTRHAPALRRAGVAVERWKDNTRRMIRLGRA